MTKNPVNPTQIRYRKIVALLKRKLIGPALFANEMTEEHRLRRRRRVDALYLPEDVDDVELSDGCWERAGARIRQMDPGRKRARAVLRELMAHH
jgi:hypothetical protein